MYVELSNVMSFEITSTLLSINQYLKLQNKNKISTVCDGFSTFVTEIVHVFCSDIAEAPLVMLKMTHNGYFTFSAIDNWGAHSDKNISMEC